MYRHNNYIDYIIPLLTIKYKTGSIVNAGMENISFGWRISTGLQLVAGCILVLGTFLLPESPRYTLVF